ncbi:hypothetical protein EUX98_g118 [Antrodiella citrinella]|uniref:Uncharacterized protein n=1 Tax=Antrodiella citrinella TaxID=2447956 RepID=A0A4S4N7B5_9APHY|nr:hypothetical protein EUX98_g118 [Antrodiella citrinella]
MSYCNSKKWQHRLSTYLTSKTASERRRYLYTLAIKLNIAENTVRTRLRKTNNGRPIPPPLYPSLRGRARKFYAEANDHDHDQYVPLKETPVAMKREPTRRSKRLADLSQGPGKDKKPGAVKETKIEVWRCTFGTEDDDDDPVSVIDLCSDSEPELDDPPSPSSANATGGSCTSGEVQNAQHAHAHTSDSGFQDVHQYLTSLGLPRLVPIMSDMGYTTQDDLILLRKSPQATKEAVLKAVRKDARVVLRDWNVLHGALHSMC